jgi:Na+-transporting NADH:ubiquinone oxidoreductase subunit C
VVNSKGEVVEGVDAFDVDLRREKAKPVEDRVLPVFECETESGLKYIFPLRGAGLWGPVWGFVSLNDDMNTIYGANFDHQSETPGLGAEISTDWFQENLKGKSFSTTQENWFPLPLPNQGRMRPKNTVWMEFRVEPLPVKAWNKCCLKILKVTKNS